ncbi:glycosyltransferase [Candidatus Margulisiibacteriota bacterium]
MLKSFIDLIEEKYIDVLHQFFMYLKNLDENIFHQSTIVLAFKKYCEERAQDLLKDNSLLPLISKWQEMFFYDDRAVVYYRKGIDDYLFFEINFDSKDVHELTVDEYFEKKNIFILNTDKNDTTSKIDLSKYNKKILTERKVDCIGHGISQLSEFLFQEISRDVEGWKNTFLRFVKNITNADEKKLHDVISHYFKGPTQEGLASLLDEIPLFSNVVITSPHGWFAQKGVLGMPDTGGQVVYILDEVKALEKRIIQSRQKIGCTGKPAIIILTRLIPDAGKTTCNQPLEKVDGTECCWILRVPFKDTTGEVVNDWMSRFDISEYLDQFVEDSYEAIQKVLDGNPNLIIGNYTDGNVVATKLGEKFDITVGMVAHALEKNKYPLSDARWEELEDHYHFSFQFTNDLLAMNKTDFVITSTFQEISGNEDLLGQYESYSYYSLPGLYTMRKGIDIYDAKFQVIPPGVSEDLYFPFYEKDRRDALFTRELEEDLFEKEDMVVGKLSDTNKIPIFTMARLDKIKNIVGLVEAYGVNKDLQNICNLLFAGGHNDLERSNDDEEREQIKKVNELLDAYNLHDKVRWLEAQDKERGAEMYKIIAEQGGIFVQPALYEAFGLTVLEAMVCGLPTMATKYGGPSEILVDGECGYLINSHDVHSLGDAILQFVSDTQKNKDLWKRISEAGIRRVQENFTWDLYAEKVLRFGKLYMLMNTAFPKDTKNAAFLNDLYKKYIMERF